MSALSVNVSHLSKELVTEINLLSVDHYCNIDKDFECCVLRQLIPISYSNHFKDLIIYS